MELSKKKLVSGLLVVGLLCGSTGVYAGTVINKYKTPRGNIATVETENIHKNRIGITVNGRESYYLHPINLNIRYNSREFKANLPYIKSRVI